MSKPFRYNAPMKQSKSFKNRPVRVGVIGLGQIALKAHLPGYAKAAGCKLTAVHSLREAHAKEAAILTSPGLGRAHQGMVSYGGGSL